MHRLIRCTHRSYCTNMHEHALESILAKVKQSMHRLLRYHAASGATCTIAEHTDTMLM